MEDKLIMENLLGTSKSLCVLLNHASIEANDSTVSNCFKKLLTNLLSMQHDIYKTMQESGWYPVEEVKATVVNKLKTKFANQ